MGGGGGHFVLFLIINILPAMSRTDWLPHKESVTISIYARKVLIANQVATNYILSLKKGFSYYPPAKPLVPQVTSSILQNANITKVCMYVD